MFSVEKSKEEFLKRFPVPENTQWLDSGSYIVPLDDFLVRELCIKHNDNWNGWCKAMDCIREDWWEPFVQRLECEG